MANRLKMAMVQTIVRLLQQGWSPGGSPANWMSIGLPWRDWPQSQNQPKRPPARWTRSRSQNQPKHPPAR